MVKINKVISLGLIYLLLVFAIVWLIFHGINSTFLAIIALFILGFVIYFLIDNLMLNKNYKIFAGLAIWLNALSYAYLYQRYLYFGYFVHFIDSILITYVVYDYFKKNFKTKEIYLFIFIFLTVVGIISSWEVYEYFSDKILQIHLQGIFVSGKFFVYPIDDTMIDLTIGYLVTILTLVVRKVFSSKPY